MSLQFYFKYYLYYLVAEYESASVIIKITVILATFLAILFMFSILFINVQNLIYIRQKKISTRFTTSYRKNITDILSAANAIDESIIKKHLGHSKDIYNKRHKKIYTEELIATISKIKHTQHQVNQDNLMTVLLHFQLPNYWQNIILKGSLSKRKYAFRTMDELENLLSGSVLSKSVYHRNKDFRKQTRAAFIEYDKNDPYKFFEESFDVDFNALDEIRLHHYLQKKSKKQQLPPFSRWVENAQNDDFKRFIIKEIGLLKQQDSAGFLTKILKSETNVAVQKQIIETLGLLDYKEADEVLITMYSNSPTSVQKSIIETLAKFKSEKTWLFLGETYQHSHDSSIKIQLAYALSSYGIEGYKKIKTLSQKNNRFDVKILAQINFANTVTKNQTTTPK